MALKDYTQSVDLSGEDIADIIKNTDKTNYVILQEYYEGKHAILTRPNASPTAPNNKLVNNFPGYITGVNVGYFMGKPVSYSAGREASGLLEDLKDIFVQNDEQAENARIAKIASIKGKAYELLWLDEDGQVKFYAVEPENMILVYDNKITPVPLYAIRYRVKDKTTYAELYTKDMIYQFEGEDDKLVQVGEANHPFMEVPVIEYLNNDEGMGDFERVLTLIDAYDRVQSDSSNDFEYFADAFLKIKNMSSTTGADISEMKKNRVILVDEDGDASWLTKDINDKAAENHKSRIQSDIHRFSLTPNLTDEAFAGNLSGVALQFKLWGLEQASAQKERKFKKGLQRRIKLICNFLGLHDKKYDWRGIQITFTRNIPAQLTDAVEAVTKLTGILSRETLFALLPFVDDAYAEITRLDAEAVGVSLEPQKTNSEEYLPTTFVSDDDLA